MFSHHVFENDQGKWSLVHPKMESYFKSSQRNFIVGPGINSAEVYPSTSFPTHGITSHLSDGMSGERMWNQYNLKTGKSRLSSCITWNTEDELETILADDSMIHGWRQKMNKWKDVDLGYFQKYSAFSERD